MKWYWLILAFLVVSLRAEEPPLVQDDFEMVSGLWKGGSLEEGVMKVAVNTTVKYNGGLLLLTPPVSIPPDANKNLHIRFKIVGFSAEGSEGMSASARIFLIPEPLPKFVEPYSVPDAFVLWVNYDSQNEASISLHEKVNALAFGKTLYKGTLPTNDFPLQVDLYLSKNQYRLVFDQDVLSDKGSLSGLHELPESLWSGDLRFGSRIVNEREGVNSQVWFDDVLIETSDFRK